MAQCSDVANDLTVIPYKCPPVQLNADENAIWLHKSLVANAVVVVSVQSKIIFITINETCLPGVSPTFQTYSMLPEA